MKAWQLVNFCEIDKYAAKSYCAVHNVDAQLNLGDITQVDETQLADFTMLCGASPCQDFSVSGKQAGAVWTCTVCGHKYNPLETHRHTRDKCPICGAENIVKTRSSLLVEYLRVLRAKHPKFAMYENVKNIVGKQFKQTFDLFIAELNEYGYNAYWKVINAKDYGVPQNRERVYIFIVDKALDNGKFKFPERFDNGIRLKDVLEDEVAGKYYLSAEYASKFVSATPTDDVVITQNPHGYNKGGHFKDCTTITANSWECNNFLKTQTHIRKLTPKECWRLMGFTDGMFNAAKLSGVSDSQLYKQAGNSIVTDVLYYIYAEIYEAMPYLFEDLKLTSLFSGIGAFEVALDRLFETLNTGNFIQPQQKCNNFVCGDNKPVLVGGIGVKNYGKQYRQGNRVYSSDNVAMACLAQPIGNAGGYSYLYLIDDTYKCRTP